MTPFINVQISNEAGFAEIEDKNPTDTTIHNYISMIVRTLLGLTFAEQTVYEGMQEWCNDYAQRTDTCDY